MLGIIELITLILVSLTNVFPYMMPILVKGDDIRSGTKVNSRRGRLRAARESMSFFGFQPYIHKVTPSSRGLPLQFAKDRFHKIVISFLIVIRLLFCFENSTQISFSLLNWRMVLNKIHRLFHLFIGNTLSLKKTFNIWLVISHSFIAWMKKRWKERKLVLFNEW